MSFQTSEFQTELSDNSDKWLSIPTVKPLTSHTIISDYSDKLKSRLIECTKNMINRIDFSCMNEGTYGGKTKGTSLGLNLRCTSCNTLLTAPPSLKLNLQCQNAKKSIKTTDHS